MTDKLIVTDGTTSGLSAGSTISDTDYFELQQTTTAPASTVNQQFSAIKTWIKSWIAKADVGLSNASNIKHNFSASADPSATDDSASNYSIGSLWYRNDTTEMWYCLDATASAAVWAPRWGQFGSPRRRFYSYIDFVSGSQTVSYQDWALNVGASGTIADVAVGSLNAAGVVSMGLSTGASGRASIAPVNFDVIKLGIGRARFECKLTNHIISDGTNTYTTRLGFIDSLLGDPTDGCFFRQTNAVNGGAWQAVTRSNGVETGTAFNTGITPVNDAGHLFSVDVNAAGTSVEFKIDGAVVATSTANIPTGAGRETAYGITTLQSAGATAMAVVYVDFAEVEQLFTTAR